MPNITEKLKKNMIYKKEIGPEFSCGGTNMVVSRKYITHNFNLFLETVPGVLRSENG